MLIVLYVELVKLTWLLTGNTPLTNHFDRVLRDVYHVRCEAVLSELFRDEVSHCNMCLLVICVARDLNKLHAVQQCWGYCRCCVRRRDEQHLREVKGHIQVTGFSVKVNQTTGFNWTFLMLRGNKLSYLPTYFTLGVLQCKLCVVDTLECKIEVPLHM